MIRGLQTKLVDDTTKFTKQIEVVDKKLKESRQPGEMLDYWRTLMEKKGQGELEKKATEDVEKVMVDAAANPELKARAEVLKGITLRNQGKYVEAKALLEKGKAALNAGDIAWKLQADVALKEANDPVSHFVELSEKQESMNQIVESVNSLSKAIELSAQFSPKRRSELLADRCLMEIERAQVRGKGKVQLNDPSLLAAAKDADEAVLSKTALGYYAKGRVAEVRGEIIDAIDFYRKAVNENKALDAQGIVYRIALARLLNSVLPTNIKPKEADGEKVGVLEKKEPEMLTNLFALLLTGFYFQQPEIVFPPESPKISPKESRKLADEILASPDAPFDAKAQAYAIKGLPTKAIREYVIGLREKMGPIHFENLMKIIEDHPSLTNHNLGNQANPVEAERFYATGMALYFNKRYLEAEKAFMAAVENERQDARYQYYLGLSRLAQNKAEAAEAFEAASKYEKLGRPSRAAVSTSLERVQGPQRQVLNTYRNNPNR
jgi:tetratricopeptide (TPR) repeat protein